MRKILVIGHARHGKDTVAESIAHYTGKTYKGSSEICARFINKRISPSYPTDKACFDDRANHRAIWHSLIKGYNAKDKAKLATLIFDTNLVYCGVRDTAELDAIIAKFDPVIIWVDASADKRQAQYEMPQEPKSSMNIKPRAGWNYIHNNGSLKDLEHNVVRLLQELGYTHKWDARFHRLALEAASWSVDPDQQVGCVLVSPDRRKFSFGYNGLPADYELLKGMVKNDYSVHAELNAILNANRSLEGWILYSTKAPCLDCAMAIAQAGIAIVLCPAPTGSWCESQRNAKTLLESLRIDVQILSSRDEKT